MNTYGIENRKNEIIQTTWQYLVQTGLINATVRDLCRQTNLSQSSLYYWFKNKDDIWLHAGIYGFFKVFDTLLDYREDYKNNIRKYFDTLLERAEAYNQELRLAIQIITSPLFGERMRDMSNAFTCLYEKNAEKIMTIFGCTQTQAKLFISAVSTVVMDYVIWDDKEKTQMLFENLYDRTIKKGEN